MQLLEAAITAALAARETVDEVRARVEAVLAEYRDYASDVVPMLAAEAIERDKIRG